MNVHRSSDESTLDYALKTEALKGPAKFLSDPAWVCILWIGITIGITMVAIPAVFATSAADHISRISIASRIFAEREFAEFVLLVILLISIRLGSYKRQLMLPILAVAMLVMAQAVWLMPELQQRAAEIADGLSSTPSSAHRIYSILEVIKMISLAGIAAWPRFARRQEQCAD